MLTETLPHLVIQIVVGQMIYLTGNRQTAIFSSSTIDQCYRLVVSSLLFLYQLTK